MLCVHALILNNMVADMHSSIIFISKSLVSHPDERARLLP